MTETATTSGSRKTRLNQILAIEKGIKTRVYRETTDLWKAAQKPDLVNGFRKKFEAKEEGGETFPEESKVVQFAFGEVFKAVQAGMEELVNITGTKDWANCEARADVVIDGKTLLTNSPATHLLFLEKQLQDMHTFVSKMTILDPGEEWTWDASSGYHRTGEISQHRTKKLQKPLVLHPPTKEHPAQTQMITEDVTIGYWRTVKTSGALPRSEQKTLLARIEKLKHAVVTAREEANNTEVRNQHHGKAVMDFIFAD